MSESGKPTTLDEATIAGLRELAEATETELLLELAELFVSNVGEQIQLIRTSIAAGDAKTAARTSHSLRGSAGTLGALELSAACKALELYLDVGLGPDRLAEAERLRDVVAAEALSAGRAISELAAAEKH